jgi:hypothetical protein
MRSRRALAASTVAALAAVALDGTATLAGDDGGDDDLGDKNALLAEAQFQLFLLTAGFVPTDITCTNPPVRDVSGELLCYALISDRVSVAALATMDTPGTYTYLPLNKIDPAELGEDPTRPLPPVAPGSPDSAGATDDAVLASIELAVSDAEGLGRVLTDNNSAIVSVDLIDYHSPTSTVQVTVTTDVADPNARDGVAFFVTDVMAFLWAENQPARASGLTVHPRLEVTVDGVIYGTPFEVMTQVADYAISEGEWLDIVTGNSALGKAVKTTKAIAKIDGQASSPQPASAGAT